VNVHAVTATLFILGWYAERSREIDVAVVVEKTQIAVGVHHRFADVEHELPLAGRLAVDDSHDEKHGAVTYCYSFETPRGLGQLEIYDSDFGMHTARVFRVSSGDARCPLLRSAPYFIVGERKYSLVGPDWSAPPRFESDQGGDVQIYTLEWTDNDSARRHMWGTCFTRSIRVTIERTVGTISSGTVQNWEEPGC
jgi:hypothetical protein